MRGAGSLAHEWWHGLDDYLGHLSDGKKYLSESTRKYVLFDKLLDTIKYKPETPEQAAMRTEKQRAQMIKNAEYYLDAQLLYCMRQYGDDQTKAEYTQLKAAFLGGAPDALEQLSAFKKRLSGHIIPKSEREYLAGIQHILKLKASEKLTVGHVETEYYRNSQRMDQVCEKNGGYWSSNTEMTARAFATYVMDKLPFHSDYLVGHAECAMTFITDKNGDTSVLKAYPQGEERAAINAVFDEIIVDLKHRHILTEEIRPQLGSASPTIYNQEDGQLQLSTHSKDFNRER